MFDCLSVRLACRNEFCEMFACLSALVAGSSWFYVYPISDQCSNSNKNKDLKTDFQGMLGYSCIKAVNNFLSYMKSHQSCILGKMNLLMTIKKYDSCGPFNLMFSVRKRDILPMLDLLFWSFDLSGFNTEQGYIVFINLGFDIHHL